MESESSLEALKARRPEAVAAVVREHAGFLLRAARGLGLPQADAEELVQDSFAAFLQALPRFEGRSTARTFLYGILFRKALELRRKQRRELATDPVDAVFDGRFGAWGHWSRPPAGPEREAEAKEVERLLAECLDGLSPQQRAAFVLKEVEQEPSEAVRNVLEVGDTHLRVLLFRARNKLRECLEKKWSKPS